MLDTLLAKFAFNAFEAIFKKASKGISEKIDYALAAKAYARKMYKYHSFIRIFGMSNEVLLYSCYVRLYMFEELTHNQIHNLKDLLQSYDLNKHTLNSRNNRKTLTAIKLLNENPRFIVLGKPGAGKTTLLKHYILQSLDGKTDRQHLPVFISLKAFSSEKKTLFKYITEQFSICQFPNTTPFVENLLKNGDALILMDGLDEVQELDKERVIQEINNLTKDYDENQFVISCRTPAYHNQFLRFKNVEIADFEDEQIELFINQWFSKNYQIADDCWKKLKETPRLKEIASIPLLLALICSTYDKLKSNNENISFSINQARIFNTAVEVLLKKWDQMHSISRSPIYKELSLPFKKQLLSYIAYHSFVAGEYLMPQRRLEQLIESFFRVSYHELQIHQIDYSILLQDIESHHGILAEVAQGIHSFSHRIFQEYFTAEYIVKNESEKLLMEIVHRYILDSVWREVMILIASLLPKADTYLNIMLKKAFTILESMPVLKEVLRNLNTPTNSDNHNFLQDRSLEIYYIIDTAIEIASENTNEETNSFFIENELIRDSDLMLINALEIHPDSLSNIESYIDIETSKNSAKMISNNIENIQKIYEYLIICEMIIVSLKSGAYVTRDTEEKLLNNLLTIPPNPPSNE